MVKMWGKDLGVEVLPFDERVADDFTVTDPGGWTIGSVETLSMTSSSPVTGS